MSEILEYVPPQSLIPFFTSESFISLICGPIGCLRGDSLVLTEEGAIPIADITRPMRVLSWNAETNQYQLSQASVSFPKGMDYLYQVVTPTGEFVAAGRHLLLCADGEYRRVEDLRVGDTLSTCVDSQPLTSSVSSLLSLPANAPYCQKKDANCQDGYGVLDRLHGLLSLVFQAGGLSFAPLHNGAPTYTLQNAQTAALPSDVLLEELLTRTRRELSDGLFDTDGFFHHGAHHTACEADCISLNTSVHHEQGYLVSRLSHLTKWFSTQVRGFAQNVQDFFFPYKTPNRLSTSNRAILSIERLKHKDIYWDIQVDGTHNYVTVDGAIHHNSGKTSAGIIKIAYHAKQMAPCKDKVRRSRCIWIRNTREQLKDTSIPDFLKWFPDGLAGYYEKTNSKFILKFDDVECEILFRGLDDTNDVRRLLSLQASFAVMDEFREINKDIFEAVQGRLGRYPDRMMQGGKFPCIKDDGTSNKHIWGMTNPPNAETFWSEFMDNPPANAEIFRQPSGFSPRADWIEYLPEDYYANLAEGKDEDWIDVYINSKFGKSLAGKPVYRSFDQDFHVASGPLLPILNGMRPIIVGMDFGLNPSAAFGQIDMRGRANILAEATSDGMGITRFISTMLKPILAQKFPGCPVLIAGDPAGTQRVQTDEKTVYDILKSEGFKAVPANTNSIVARIAAVETYLARQIDGQAGLLIDPSCKGIITGFRGGYRYRIKTTGEMEDKPEKNAASHLADACFVAGTLIKTISGDKPIEQIRQGDFVATPIGYRKVTAWAMTGKKTVSQYIFSNGTTLICTPNHPVFVANKGFIPVDAVQYSDILISITTANALSLVGKRTLGKLSEVYNISVDQEEVYYANGILVHNCQYLFLHIDMQNGGRGAHTRKRVVTKTDARGWT